MPTSADHPLAADQRAAYRRLLTFDRPFLIAFSDGDPITAPFAERLRAIAGASGQRHVTITGAGHFLQEDRGEELAAVVNDFIG